MRKFLKVLIITFFLIIFIICFLKNDFTIIRKQQLFFESEKLIDYISYLEEIKIIKEPENIEVEENGVATFKVEATGTNLKYLWMRSKDGEKHGRKHFMMAI